MSDLSQFSVFIRRSWEKYHQLTPDAPRIHSLLAERGDPIANDHVAYRTFNLPGISRMELGGVFEHWGYRRAPETLDFPDKKLEASYWLPPNDKLELLPKVFISELRVHQCSPELQKWIQGLAVQARSKIQSSGGKFSAETFFKPLWEPVSFEDYQRFYSESEYAAWTAAFGIQLNHFTVFFNSLKSFGSLEELNEFLVARGFTLNSAGGVIKGTPESLLEQSSTMAKKIRWKFAKGLEKEIPGCYYEFARRYPLKDSSGLFQGFIPKSADKIFESTFEQK
jgi:hypothetical protein